MLEHRGIPHQGERLVQGMVRWGEAQGDGEAQGGSVWSQELPRETSRPQPDEAAHGQDVPVALLGGVAGDRGASDPSALRGGTLPGTCAGIPLLQSPCRTRYQERAM